MLSSLSPSPQAKNRNLPPHTGREQPGPTGSSLNPASVGPAPPASALTATGMPLWPEYVTRAFTSALLASAAGFMMRPMIRQPGSQRAASTNEQISKADLTKHVQHIKRHIKLVAIGYLPTALCIAWLDSIGLVWESIQQRQQRAQHILETSLGSTARRLASVTRSGGEPPSRWSKRAKMGRITERLVRMVRCLMRFGLA